MCVGLPATDQEEDVTASVTEPRPLGRVRNVVHDPRSLRYPFKASAVPLVNADHEPHIDVLDQGDIGSCTGNAPVTALGCGSMYETLATAQQAGLNEDLAVRWYENNTKVDTYAGTYPPDDTGSDGLAAGKTGVQFGYVSGYLHALTLDDALTAIVLHPIIVGVDWYEGFDSPSSSGLVQISGSIRGGHEFCLRKIDVDNKLVWARNSWGLSYGVQGEFCFSFDTLGTLLSSNGDATILTPITVAPPPPLPTSGADATLYTATLEWSRGHHSGANAKAAEAVQTWAKAKAIS
jgi:hypothetical protein